MTEYFASKSLKGPWDFKFISTTLYRIMPRVKFMFFIDQKS